MAKWEWVRGLLFAQELEENGTFDLDAGKKGNLLDSMASFLYLQILCFSSNHHNGWFRVYGIVTGITFFFIKRGSHDMSMPLKISIRLMIY